MDADGSRYQAGRRIVAVDIGWLTPDIGVRSCVDSDWLDIGNGSGKIDRDLVFRDGFGGRHMERGELWEFWHNNFKGISNAAGLF